ncbi:glycosyltransferase family 39 protein [Parachitinimonas caeni]|nr:glycosyltransferase family 39 protein [Parachitinimonas caeni]
MPAAQIHLRRWLVVILLAVLWFGALGYRKLIHPDEGRYAEIAREMSATGDWVTPRLNGIKYFEKPALQYWAGAASYKVFGENEWSARFWPALMGFMAILMVGFTGRRLWGERVGDIAALVLAGTFWHIANGHFLTLDMGVSAWMAMTLCAFLLAQRDEATPREARRWMLVAWAAMALAVLSKGLIGLVLPGGVLVVYTVWSRDWNLWRRLELLRGIALFLLIAAPWFIWVSLRNPEFPHFFFIHEHFERFTSTEHKREGAWWYFFPILAIGVIPWLSLLPQGLVTGCRRGPGRFQAAQMLLVWSVFIFAFFSKSGSKLPSYILPIFPALALLFARVVDQMAPKNLGWHLILPIVLGVFTMTLPSILAFDYKLELPRPLFDAYAPWVVAAGGLIVAGAAFGGWLARRGMVRAAILACTIGTLTGGQVAMLGHNELRRTSSAAGLADDIRPYIGPNTKLYSLRHYEQTLPFYLQRTFTLVEFGDELSFGLRQEPGKHEISLAEFLARWPAEKDAVAVTSPDFYAELQQRGLKMRLLSEDSRRVAFAPLP